MSGSCVHHKRAQTEPVERAIDTCAGRALIDQGSYTAIGIEYTVQAQRDPISRVWEWAGTFRATGDFPLPARGAATLRLTGQDAPIVITRAAPADRGDAGCGHFLGCGAPPPALAEFLRPSAVAPQTA